MDHTQYVCAACRYGYGLAADGGCEECARGESFSDGTTACTSRCAAFSRNQTVCVEAGFCLWNSKYSVCYREEQSAFVEIVVKEDADVEAVVEALKEEHPGVVVVVGSDEDGRTVVLVQGDEAEMEAIRRLPSECSTETETSALCGGVGEVKDVEAGVVQGAEKGKSGVNKSAFVAGTVVGGIAIVSLIAAVIVQATKLKQSHSFVSL